MNMLKRCAAAALIAAAPWFAVPAHALSIGAGQSEAFPVGALVGKTTFVHSYGFDVGGTFNVTGDAVGTLLSSFSIALTGPGTTITFSDVDPFPGFQFQAASLTAGHYDLIFSGAGSQLLSSYLALVEVSPVPEPATRVLALTGALALSIVGWRRRGR
jgi:hypothetical protein